MKLVQQTLLLWTLIHVIFAKEETPLDGFTLQPLNSSIGIYFEKISEIFLFNNEWNIVFHINLTTIQQDLKIIQVTINDIDQLCTSFLQNFTQPYDAENNIKLSRACGATLIEIKIMLKNIEDFNVDWFFINHSSTNNNNNKVKRKKRGAFNIVGNILNSLFGTLSQEDAEMYLNQFKELKIITDESKMIIDKQTTLIKSTAKILDKYSQENKELYTQIQDDYEIVKNYTLNLEMLNKSIWLSVEVQFRIENLLLLVSLFLTSFNNRQRHFLEALTLLSNKHSQNPILLPPGVLINELSNIQAKIQEKNLKLPLDVNRDTLPYFYQIATTRSRILEDQFLITMSIPLVKLEPYDLIKATSVPHKISNDLYSFIIPEHEYVAIDSYRQNFISFTNQELENCYDLQYRSHKYNLICMQSSPINQISSTDDCSITLLAQNKLIKKCDVRVSNTKSQVWLKLREMNAWIYVFPKIEVVYIKCYNKAMEEKLLQGTGIIRIKQECQIKSNGILIEAHTVFHSDIFQEIRPKYIPEFDFNLTHYVEELEKEVKIKQIDSPHIISFGKSNQLKELSDGIEELESFQRTKIAEKTNNERKYIVLLLLLFICIVTLSITIYCYCKRKCHSENKSKRTSDIELDYI